MGYIDATSQKEVIPCIYNEARPFNEVGFAVVNKKGKYGMVDKQGNEVVKSEFDEISSFKKGIAVVTKSKKKGLLSEHGKLLTEVVYNFISDFNVYGIAWVNIGGKVDAKAKNCIKGGKWGVLAQDGSIRVPCQNGALFEFSKELKSEGYSGCEHKNLNFNQRKESDTLVTAGKYFAISKKLDYRAAYQNLIDGNGNVVMPADKENALFFEPKSGMVCCFYKDVKKKISGYRYYNLDTKQYITVGDLDGECAYGDFTEQIAPIYVKVDKNTVKTIFITKQGEKSEKYDYTNYLATSDSTGQWIASASGKCSLFDTNKELIIPEGRFSFIQFPDYSLPTFPGYAVRDMDGNWGVVDKQLNEQIPFKYKGVVGCGNWFYAKDKNKLWGIIDGNGNIVVDHQFYNIRINTNGKEPKIMYTQTSENSTYRLYNIAEKKLYTEEYANVVTLDNNYSWVVPSNSELFNDKYAYLTYKHIIPEEIAVKKAEGEKDTTIPVGFVIDNRCNHIVQSPITLKSWIYFMPEVYRKEKLGKRLTLSDEHRILLNISKRQRVYPMNEIIKNVEWDF